jgi:hypothetical protein
MDPDIIILHQQLIDGVVVSVVVNAAMLSFVKESGQGVFGDLQYRMRPATPREMQDWRDGIDLAKWLPV